MAMFATERYCGPAEHPLQQDYIFSFFVKPASDFIPSQYNQCVQQVACVKSVEQFWSMYSHIRRPSDYEGKIDLHFFKKGIRPVWEDPSNIHGGKWILHLRPLVADRIWENLLLAIVGEQFHVGEEICGAVCCMRRGEVIISVWNRSADNQGVVNRIKDTLTRALNLPSNTVLLYKRNDECLLDSRSYSKPTIAQITH